MNLSTLVVFLLFMGRSMAVNNYEGLYRLSQLFDDEMGEIPLPDKEFKVKMEPDAKAGVPNSYNMGLLLGNSMGGSVIVSESDVDGKDAVKIGSLRSTMMMPPEDVFTIEMALRDTLPASTLIHLERNDELLVIEGPKGKMICTRLS
jgi:hypothetical protein